MHTAVATSPGLHDDATTQQLVWAGAWMVATTGTLIALLLLRDSPVSWTHVLLNLGAGVMGAVAVLLGRLKMIGEYGLVDPSGAIDRWFERMQATEAFKQADIWMKFQPWRIVLKR